MPSSINIPWWGYVIVVVLIVVAGLIAYKKLTAYRPSQSSFQQNEGALPQGFDAAGQANYASNVLSETFGSDDHALIQTLSNMTDNELIATSNSFNDQYFSTYSASLLTLLKGLSFPFSSSKDRDNLTQRMTQLQIT